MNNIHYYRKHNKYNDILNLFGENIDVESYNIILSVIPENIHLIEHNIISNILDYKNDNFNSLNQKISIYCLINNFDKTLLTLDKIKKEYKIIKKKTIIPIINYLYANINETYVIENIQLVLNPIIDNNIILDSESYFKIISLCSKDKAYLDRLIEYFIKNVVILNGQIYLENLKYSIFTDDSLYEIIGERCNSNIIDFVKTNNILKYLGERINKKTYLEGFKQWCNNNMDCEYILDCANIIFFNNHPKFSFNRIQILLDKLCNKKIKLFIHERHIKNLDIESRNFYEKNKKNIFLTPRNLDDDYFWLYYYIFLVSKNKYVNVISNDDIKDHIFKINNYLGFIRDNYFVKYSFSKSQIQLYFPTKIKKITQIYDNNIIIPYNENFILIKNN